MVRLSLLRLCSTVAREIASDVPATTPSPRLPPLPSPRDLLRLYQIRAQRHLSQNFIMDSRLTNKIVTRTGKVKGCYVCEVGPGPGNITRPILENGAKQVIVVEKDRRFIPALELLSDASNNRLKIILGDIMDLNLENILPKELACPWNLHPPPLYIIGNLPFNISTPLIIKWLRYCSTQTGPFVHGRTQLSLTFQKEVADRIVAHAGQTCRSRLSVMCQYLFHVDVLFTIPGRAFFPKPEVDVSVVKFTPRIRPLIKHPFNLVNKLVSTLFQHKQKYLHANIVNLFPTNRQDLVEHLITKSRVNPEKRPYLIDLEEYISLCDTYAEMCLENEGILDYNYQVHKRKKETFINTIEMDTENKDI